MSRGKFFMIEGMDGAGKGTIVDVMMKECEKKKTPVFDIRAYEQKHKRLPSDEEIREASVLVIAEPSFSGIGASIREHLLTSEDYAPLTLAHAFAVNREILYKKIIVDALERGAHVVEERSVVSSLIFQPIHGNIPREEIVGLPGNVYALEHPPDTLVIATVDPKTAVQRARMRAKDDSAFFEAAGLQEKFRTEYQSDWLKKMFEEKGTQVMYLDTSGDIKDTEAFAKTLAKDLLKE